ncbi:T9SS type B sorting domain-containing protein [Pseudotenacibaculum haliotis]|uniref:T9SS type B sorting domain-containing protein n=1 Tax=Pseudotenacibaculum haliotis TaxID=1862138 RepID=A0ABW5LTE4_9FLAO
MKSFKSLLLFLFLFAFSKFSFGQICDELTPVCSNQPIQDLSAEDPSPFTINSSCQSLLSSRVLWYRVRIETGTRFTFHIVPSDPNADYDFAVFGPDSDCSNLASETPIRASYSGTTGLTGLSPNPAQNECDTAGGDRFVRYIDVNPGEEYIIVIDRFSGAPSTFDLLWNVDESGNPLGSSSLDCSIVVGDLGMDQEVCEGTEVTLDGTPSTLVGTETYKWFIDEGAGFTELVGQTNPTLVINDDRSGTYKVEVTDGDGNMGEDEVVITFFPQPTIGTLPFTTYEQCDTDGTEDGFFTFDLEALFSTDLLNGQDASTFEVVYYASQSDADNNANPLNANSYTNPTAFTSVEVFARVIVSAVPNVCTAATTSFNLLVNPNPTLQNPADYEICDDATDGDDTNGTVQNFLLSTKDTDVLGSLNPADYTVSYFDIDSNPIDKNNPYTNIANPQPIIVRVENNTTGCFTESTGALFNLVVNPLPNITTPVLLELCDTDQDGLASFDLTLANSSISANSANETFRYYPTEADAIGNTNEILNPTNHTNIVDTNDAVWVRVITVNGCYRIARINLEVTNTVIPNTFQRTYNECDDYLDTNGNDNANNDDTDGITTFDFSSATNDIIALFPASQTLNISYYESLTDANNAMNAITDISNYRNINSPNTQQIFIRVENPANNACLYTGTHITLVVDPVPTADAVTDMGICDDNDDGDDTNGFIQSIDLETQTATILGTQDPGDFTVTYHESTTDATSGANALSSPFSNTTANTQTIYVRVTNNATGCYTDRTSFVVNIRPLPVITAAVELKQCDNDTDGFSVFNLNEAATDISTNYMNETFIFYETLADAQSGNNPIPNPTTYTNQVVTSDTVWARAISSFDCYRISEVTLTVSTTGIPSTFQRVFNVCDDFLDINGDDNANNDDTDGITTFDFSSVTTEVRALFPTTQQLTITYYRNEADALAEQNAITDPANYRNIGYPNSQQIYVRVDSNLDNDCLGFGAHITLNVDPIPTANPVTDLELCDNADDGDFTNGIVQTFDLDSQTPVLLGTQNPADFTVSYHLTAADANSGNNPITNTSAYENASANQQTIYVRMVNNTTGCFNDHASFDLIVNPLPVANFVEDLEVCDDDTDGSAQNGFSQNINLELQTAGILGTQDPTNFTVTYHASFADAQSGANILTSPYTNTQAFTQIIYVRITNGTTNCVNNISNFNVIINPEPTAEAVDDLLTCDDDADGDDTNGFVQDINLDSQIPLILGATQDEDDFTVTFHETQADATSGANPLSSPFSNTVANQQTIYVRVANNDTGCVNDDLTFDVIVNPLPEFSVTSPQIVCLNGPELTIGVENPAGIYDYVWTDPDGNTIIGSQITVTSGGLYTVTATTTDGTGCSRTLEIQVNESIIATITDNDVTIVDDSDNNSISIDTSNLGIGDYEYALTDENGVIIHPYQDEPLFENLEGGFYTIRVRDKNGCGIVSLDVSVIEFPKFFTPNNDGINDTWAIKGANSTFYPTSQIHIFNRFGKVMAEINIDNPGWNGTFNGKTLPSDDYWFAIKLTDRNGNTRERKGNFSLLRR